MFKKGKEEKTSTIIGKNTELKGTLKDKESVRIDGKFEGEIEIEGSLLIGEEAIIRANIKAKSVGIAGRVFGDINCEEKVELLSTGSLEGKVRASDLTIAEGGFFNGECKMNPQVGAGVEENISVDEESKN